MRTARIFILLLPTVLIVFGDVLRRPAEILHLGPRHLAFYALSVAISGAFWAGLLVAASRARGALRGLAIVVLATAATAAVGSQIYTFERYRAYMNARAVLVGTSMMPSIGQQLWSDRVSYARALAPPVIVLSLLLFVLSRLFRPSLKGARAGFDVAIAALIALVFAVNTEEGSEQGAPPDALYLSALGHLARARWDHNETVERIHPGRRTPIPVPSVRAAPSVPRNVLFVITESVRAQSVCVAHGDPCPVNPFSNAAAPNRLPLSQMRAVDSTTAISIALMWNGLAPTAPRDDLHRAPLLWEYANAAGITTAYWTSQNLLFGNSGAFLEGVHFDFSVSATEFDPDATLETGADDGVLVERVLEDLGKVRAPFMGVVHLSNTHFPYKIDYRYAPFLPEAEATGPGFEVEIRNRYHDAIYLQDRAIGNLIRGLRASKHGAKTVVVFVSDHGEQMREKGAVGHTGTLFEEEIRIPAWIDAPSGTLTQKEEASLKSLESTPLTTGDVLPTVLDLVGLWRVKELETLERSMVGESLLRGGTHPDATRMLTNCTELWACAFRNWGAMRGTRKLVAHQGDHDWSCYDIKEDPQELHNLGRSACGDLFEFAEADGRGRPF